MQAAAGAFAHEGEAADWLDAALGHLAATDWTTPYEYARSIADCLNLDRDLVRPTTFDAFAQTRPAPRPRHSWLDVSRFVALCGQGILRSFEQELRNWAMQLHESQPSPASI